MVDFNQFSKIRCGASKDDMADVRSTWAVVTTVDEPPALVQAFVAWHLSQGAEAVFLYFDRPEDPAIGLFADLAQVTVVPCDAAHWMRVGKSRPRRHQVRQVRNARDAYARTQADWLIHIDADEFLWARKPVIDCLTSVEIAADSLIVPVVERIYLAGAVGLSVLEGAFRRPFRMPADVGRAVFGPDFDLTYRGLTGHSLGKAFVRTGRPLKLSIHRAIHEDSDAELQIVQGQEDELELLHFEGLTRRYWIYKLMRMAEALVKRDGMPPSPHRRRQADALLADADGAGRLHDRLKACDDATLALLKENNLLSAPLFDPSEALTKFFPDQQIDLSPEAIDRWLEANKAKVMAFLNE